MKDGCARRLGRRGRAKNSAAPRGRWRGRTTAPPAGPRRAGQLVHGAAAAPPLELPGCAPARPGLIQGRAVSYKTNRGPMPSHCDSPITVRWGCGRASGVPVGVAMASELPWFALRRSHPLFFAVVVTTVGPRSCSSGVSLQRAAVPCLDCARATDTAGQVEIGYHPLHIRAANWPAMGCTGHDL